MAIGGEAEEGSTGKGEANRPAIESFFGLQTRMSPGIYLAGDLEWW